MKKYTHWLALLVIFLWLPISAFAQNERVWQQRIDEGKAAMGDGQYAQAEDSFRNALVEALLFGRDDRKVGVSAYNIAEALSEQGRSIEAKQLYTKALHILEEKDGPDSPPPKAPSGEHFQSSAGVGTRMTPSLSVWNIL